MDHDDFEIFEFNVFNPKTQVKIVIDFEAREYTEAKILLDMWLKKNKDYMLDLYP